ncbi:hypothetical protein OIU84_014576 [Salix udensis]|uniref:Wall-associated receptor kinase galacturonan-binding domain-containing protein n=1 Tax=Salix udensis TaxID=889485 RepID=A0AAD6JD99_9ROSI|nr:hypothetical protein OIU84_014576 [Salix udensis]
MHPLSTASATSFLFTLLLFFHLTASLPSNGASNLSNGNQNFSCGDLTNITYPFTGAQRPSHCGPPEFHLECYHNLTTTLTVNSRPYRVTQVNQTSQTLRLSILILYDDSTCIHPFNTTTFDNSSFSLVPNHSTVSLFYGCENPGDMENFKLSCPWPEYSEGFFMIGDPVPGPPFMHKCQTSFQVPILRSQEQLRDEGLSLLVEVLKEGFDVSYSNARPYCGFYPAFLCFFPPFYACFFMDDLLPLLWLLRIIGVSLASGAVLVIIVGGWVMVFKRMKKRKSAMEQFEGLPAVTPTSSIGLATSANFFRATPYIANSKSGIDKSSTYFGVRVFSYNELEEATNCFDSSKQLGDGGFGTVYHGLLRDGPLAAVDITRSVHDINLSTMAVRKIQSQALNELVDPFLGFDKDFVVREMITSVAELAFRCLQYEREMRPTIEEVVEELRGIERENYGSGKGEIEYQGR